MQQKKVQLLKEPPQRYVLPELQPYIESVCFFRGYHLLQRDHLLLKGHPEGIFDLVFQNSPSVWQSNDHGESWDLRDEAFIAGLHQRDYQLQFEPESEMVAIRFTPGSFKYFTGEKQHQFTDQRISISDVWGSRGLRLHEKVRAVPDQSGQLKVIGQFLQEQFDRAQQSVIDQAVKAVLDSKGMINLQQLEQMSCLSAAQFRKRFREEVGLSPKKYAKVIRIKALLQELIQVEACLLYTSPSPRD